MTGSRSPDVFVENEAPSVLPFVSLRSSLIATPSCCSCDILRWRACFSFCDSERILALALRASRWSFARWAERLRVTESSDRLRRSSSSFS